MRSFIVWSTRGWPGWPRSEAWMSCSLHQHLSCIAAWGFWKSNETTQSWGKLLDFTPVFLFIPDTPLVLPGPLSPCSFPGLQAQWQSFALRMGDLYALFCLLAWHWEFHTFYSGHCSVTAGVLFKSFLPPVISYAENSRPCCHFSLSAGCKWVRPTLSSGAAASEFL